MSEEYKRHLTPAPVSTSKLATIGDVFDGVGDHKNECAEERRRFAMWAIGVSVTAAGVLATVGIFLARYLIVGAITLELDRRFPHMAQAQRAVPGSVLMSSAHAGEAGK